MLDNIVYFLRLYEIKNFKNCAELFKIQPSTLSKHIIELETELKKQLIIRTSRRFEVTHFGEYIYNQFKHLPEFAENVLNVYNKTQSQTKYAGTLNITLGVVISHELICPYLNDFLTKYPEIKLNINFMSNLQMWPGHNPDVVLSNKYLKGRDFENRFVRTEYGKFYCTPSYALKYGIPETVEDLAKSTVIGVLDKSVLDKNLSPLIFTKAKNINTKEEHIIDLSNSRLNVDSAIHLKQIGMNSEFIFGCFDSLIQKELDDGLVLPVLPNLILYREEFYLTSKKNISEEAQLFIDFIYECMRR